MAGKTTGRVYLVGAGPGDPGLVTVRGMELLERADCVVYDALIPLQILGHCREGCELVDAGKRGGKHTMSQEKINALLVRKAKEYQCVVRLKGGDPLVFGRGGEEALFLRKVGVPFEIVPGVSSALAGPAYAGIPVTHRSVASQLTLVAGHGMSGRDAAAVQMDALAAAPGSKVVLMGMENLRELMDKLLQGGQAPQTPAAVIQWATTARQRCVRGTVASIADAVEAAGVDSPAVVVIGEVVDLAEELDWRRNLPLSGRRIIVTRPREQVGRLSQLLGEQGAEVVPIPMLRLVPPTDRQAFAEAVVNARHHDWLVFSSPNGVRRFFEAFFAVYEDLRELGGVRIAALGSGTAAELRKRGLMVDVMPQEAVAEKLIEEFDRREDDFGGLAHCTMLWIHAQQARRFIFDELTKRKAIVDECIAYDVEPVDAPFAERLLAQGADFIIFTSSSTVRHFVKMGLRLPESCRVVSMGPVTSKTLRDIGLPVDIEAPLHTVDSIVETICSIERG